MKPAMRIFHLDFNFVSLREGFVRELLAHVDAMGVLAAWPNILRLSTTPSFLRNTVQGA